MTIRERPSGAAIILDVDGRMTIETVNDRPLTVEVRRLLQEDKDGFGELEGRPLSRHIGSLRIVEGCSR